MTPTRFVRRPSTDMIVVHCSATPPDMDIGRKEIREWHLARGFHDIGYHFVIRRDGTIEAGRPAWSVGAHVAGKNARSVGVCLVGGVRRSTGGHPGLVADDNFTVAQRMVLKSILTGLLAAYPDSDVCGHRDLSPDQNNDGRIDPWEWSKVCPSFDVRSWWEEVNE